MASSQPSKSTTHYDVLNLSQQATKAEVRARFLKLVRIHHPDKDRQSGSAAPSSANTSRPSIHDLYEAYNVLYDERAREEYDAELSRLARLGVQSSAAATTATPSRREARISAEVDLDAFTAHEGHDAASDEDMITFTYPCRCGSHFALTSDDLLTEELDLVECSGCSEVVRVLWRDGEEADESR